MQEKDFVSYEYIYYFERTLREYQSNQHYYPRCKEDYIQIVYNIMVTLKNIRNL